ncbi:hypothetical protein L208DRAFT_1415783 [Tricholoma matsutake]|nr:hypothetical protein L208DRAFT_1415783 [Tricholoma matsutake 945]
MTSTALVARRPIPNRSQANSFSIAASESAATFTYLLANITPEELHKQLSSASTTLIPSQIETLLIALQSAGIVTFAARNAAADQTKRHCARCHQSYLEKQNGLDACIMLHCRPEMQEKDGKKVEYLFPCCGLRAIVPVSGKVHPCFKGRHTTLTENVKYGLNVWTCERTKCASTPPAAAPVPV